MPIDDYERLIDALDRLPNGFPRTPSRVELRLLAKMYSPEEAWLAGQLTGEMEPVDAIAARVGLPEKEASTRLKEMARRGLVWFDRQDRKMRYRLAPFVVGSYEAQAERMDHELAHLVEAYFDDGGTAGIMGPEPALHRVHPGPGRGEVRVGAALRRRPRHPAQLQDVSRPRLHLPDTAGSHRPQVQFPGDHVPLLFGARTPARARRHLQEDALAVLDRAEEVGLVHTVSNVAEGIGYVCNCCGCCCGVLRGITDQGIEHSVAYANYYAVIDPDTCLGCGACVERCQVQAISEDGGVSVVDRVHCIGCGLCVTGCPSGAASLLPKPAGEIVQPPINFAAWEHERLVNRHLIDEKDASAQ